MFGLPRRFWLLCLGVFVVGLVLRTLLDGAQAAVDETDGDEARAALELLRGAGPSARTVESYEGLGVWVDAFDFDPAYQSEGREPPLTPAVVDEFAALGVETLYLQAARRDDRATGRVLDEELLTEFLVRSHARGIDVVGWYLPLFDDIEADLDRLLAIAEFDAGGHEFDGIAVDIEYIEAVPDPEVRSTQLVVLSQELRDALPGDALGAIVPPTVQLEVVNPAYWPRFPWRDLADEYDVWLPMAYWTTRTPESGYRDAYRYAEESIRRMRNNLDDQSATVHVIGGIGDATTTADLDGLRRAVDDTRAVGASIYDWVSLPAERRSELPVAVPG